MEEFLITSEPQSHIFSPVPYKVNNSLSNGNVVPSLSLSKKPKYNYATLPSKKVSGLPSSTDFRLGPGKYEIHNYSSSFSFEFSKSNRFGKNDYFKKFFVYKKLSDLDREKINKLIGKNKESLSIPKEIRSRTVLEKIEKVKNRSEYIRNTKRKLIKEKQCNYDKKLKEKFLKFEYRSNLKVKAR